MKPECYCPKQGSKYCNGLRYRGLAQPRPIVHLPSNAKQDIGTDTGGYMYRPLIAERGWW